MHNHYYTTTTLHFMLILNLKWSKLNSEIKPETPCKKHNFYFHTERVNTSNRNILYTK